MSGTIAWLLDETPTSRMQARLGRLYRLTLAILANPLAVVGAVIVLTLVLTAAFAPLILMSAIGYRVTPLAILAIVAVYALEILVAFIQAYVFTILTCVYLKDALHPGH